MPGLEPAIKGQQESHQAGYTGREGTLSGPLPGSVGIGSGWGVARPASHSAPCWVEMETTVYVSSFELFLAILPLCHFHCGDNCNLREWPKWTDRSLCRPIGFLCMHALFKTVMVLHGAFDMDFMINRGNYLAYLEKVFSPQEPSMTWLSEKSKVEFCWCFCWEGNIWNRLPWVPVLLLSLTNDTAPSRSLNLSELQKRGCLKITAVTHPVPCTGADMRWELTQWQLPSLPLSGKPADSSKYRGNEQVSEVCSLAGFT